MANEAEIGGASEEESEGSEYETDLDNESTEEIPEESVKDKISLEEQIQGYKDTITKALKAKNKQDEVNALNELGVVFYNVGRYKEAMDCHERQLQLALLLQDNRIERRALCNLGCTAKHLKNYDRALDCFQTGLECTQSEGDKKGEGKFLNNLASAYEAMADFENAIKFYEMRLGLAKQTKDSIAETKCCASLGNVLHASGNIRESIRYFERVVVCIKLRIAAKNRQEQKNESTASSNKDEGCLSGRRESAALSR